MTEKQRLALHLLFFEAGIREGAVGTCACGEAARYGIDDTQPPRLACVEHAEAHARKWQAGQLMAVLQGEKARQKKLTNSELLERQQLWMEAVSPLEVWGICSCGATGPYRIGRFEPQAGYAIVKSKAYPLRWACREHAREHARAWGLRLEQWYWEALVGDWVLGPVFEEGEAALVAEGRVPKIRLIRCPSQAKSTDDGPGWPNGMELPRDCAGCAVGIGMSEDIRQQELRAHAGGAEQVLLMCSDCTRTAVTVWQFLRWKRKRQGHGWVLNLLQEDAVLRQRWQKIKTLVARAI
jgi:hypothetical protein